MDNPNAWWQLPMYATSDHYSLAITVAIHEGRFRNRVEATSGRRRLWMSLRRYCPGPAASGFGDRQIETYPDYDLAERILESRED